MASPSKFGKYELIRRIGVGGMAEVFLARTAVAQGLAKELVIKKIHPAFARSRQFVAMFVDEAKIALSLNHPNIVQVFDFGAVGDTYFLAMEFVEGLDLLRLVQEAAKGKQTVPVPLAAYIMQQVAKGLDYAHRKTDNFGEPLGIVHRDISQQNILASWDGGVKIVDFGIARARDTQEEEGVIKGKFAYMSPEQARGEPVDCRSDVFSAGVVLFELICGRPLFTGKGKAVLDKVKTGAIARPRYFKPDLPKSLEDVILKALAFHRDDRFQTARDMQHALRKFQFQHAQSENDLVDSGALAQFVSQVVPADQRRQAPPRPATAPSRGQSTPPPKPRTPPETPSAADKPLDPDVVTPPPKASSEVRERKYVFVLEGHVCGLPELSRKLDEETAQRTLASFVKVAKDIAFKHHAHVDEIKHESFRFVVGLPVASEDDSTRSLRLALALVDALDGIGLDMDPAVRLAVGIQRGMAMLTRQGGRTFTYELAEATTKIARRLAREAQGAEVLVGGRVYRLARYDWNFEELTSIDVPADPETQPDITRSEEDSEPGVKRARVYRLRGPKERAERLRALRRPRGELIGRDLELKALRDAYRDALVSRKKRQILILGDSGVGKRSLVTAFLDSIPKDEAVVLRAAAHVSKALTPFAIVADLARDMMGLADGAASAEVMKRMERVAMLLYPNQSNSREVRGLIQAAGMLLGARSDGESGSIDADERKERIYEAVTRVEERLGNKKPLIVVGEDAHWADDESMELFVRLLKVPRSRPIFGLVTSRPDPKIYRLAEETSADVVQLEELSARDRIELVTRRFVPGEDVGDLAKQIVSRTGGNPFFIEEMLDALTEKGIVAAEGDDSVHPGLLRWIARDAPIQVPSTVESLIATRLDVLPQSEKETLFHAAIFGRVFDPLALEKLVGRPVEDALRQLVSRGLIGARNAQYVFRNDITMTVAYSLLPEEERTRLHRAVAERIAGAGGYRQGQDDAVIARHLELAGDADSAADRYLAAATHALDVGGNAEAFRQLTRALKLLPQLDHARRFVARKQREEILGRLARRPEQLREIHSLRKEAEALADSGKVALAYCRLAQFYIDVGRAPAASRAVTPALQHARDAGDKLGVAEALRLRSSIARLVGNNEESIALCEQALAMCSDDRAGRLQRGTILNNRGTALWNMGRLGDAIHSYAEALVIYRGLELPRQEARALNNMGIVFAALGEFEEALAHYKSSLKLDQEMGDRDSIALKLGNIGQTYADLGDVDRGERYLKKALKIADEMSDRASATDGTISLGQVYLQKQDYRRALEFLDRGLSLAMENRERYQEIRALIYISLAQVESGEPPDGALDLARSATELARKMPMAVGEIFGLAIQGLALAKLGKLDEAADATAEAARLQAEQDQPEGAEQILHIHATISDQAGRTEAATVAITAAREELLGKAVKIHDQGLKQTFLTRTTAAAIAADYTRLTGHPFDA